MKLVVLDGYTENPGDLSWEALRAFGEVTIYERTSYVDAPIIAERLQDADIAVVNKTPITKQTLDACPHLKLICVLATGYNVVDCACAKEKGIPVCNVPAYGTASVSQFAIALLLELCHHIGHHSETVHAGRWANNADWCYWDYPMVELAGVLAHSPHESDEGRRIGTYVDLDTLLRESDVISLHCPLTKDNAELINRQTIAKMKDGALLVNNARGQLLNEQDVADALNSGKLAGAALDVVSAEPVHADNPLLSAKNCILTPHISWAPLESRQRIMDITAANIQAFLNGAPQNVVNK